MQISLDDDDGNEQTPIILDESPDVSIDIVRFLLKEKKNLVILF